MNEATPSVLPFCDAWNDSIWFITLKTWPEFWDAIKDGRKTFEIRLNDRPYRVGSILLLQRWEPDKGDYTRDENGNTKTISRRVTFILSGGQFGLSEKYVAMGLARVWQD